MKFAEAFSLNHKTALVTGAAGILGKAFCEGLAEYGANIALVDIQESEASKHAHYLEEIYGIKAKAFGCDITSPDSVKTMVAAVVATFGEIHILHNNAAGKAKDLQQFFKPFEGSNLTTWQEMHAVNINGMFLVAQAVGNVMIAQNKGGSIIQTASIYGMMAPDQRIYEGSQYMGALLTPQQCIVFLKQA